MTQLAAVIAALAAWQPLGLAAIFLGLLIEGEIVIFTAMFLTHQGAFDLRLTIPVIISAVALNDLLWHRLGQSTYVTSERVVSLTKKIGAPIDALLKKYPFRTFLITKFTYGLMRPTIIRSGMVGIPIKDFIKYDYPAAVFWITIVGGLGFFAGASLPFLKHYFKLAEIALVVVFIAFFILHHVIIKIYLKNQTRANS